MVGQANELIGWAIIILAAGHALTALFHYFVLHDDVLLRMLPGRQVR
jgi:cytochrome b561